MTNRQSVDDWKIKQREDEDAEINSVIDLQLVSPMVLPSFSYLKKNKLFHRCPVKKTEAGKGREYKGAGVKTEAVGGVGEPRLRLKSDDKRKTSVTD